MVVALEKAKSVRSVARKLVPLKRLTDAAHNPPARIADKNIRELVDSMDRIGLLHPITINAEYEIIDGHRRVASARKLGWLDIECNVVEEDSSEVYASVNVTARRMSGNDALAVWLVNPHAVPTASASRFTEMETAIGRVAVKKISSAGYSIRVYQTARRIARYCDDLDAQTVTAIVLWLLETATIGQVMKALESGQSPKVIMEAVRKGKPIVFRMVVAD